MRADKSERAIVRDIQKLKKDPSAKDVMEDLYQRTHKDNRNEVGSALTRDREGQLEESGFLHTLTENAVAVEQKLNGSPTTYLRQPTLTTKLIYIEAASKLSPDDVNLYLNDFKEFCREFKFKVDDSLIRYYAPVFAAMKNDPAYSADAFSQEQRIGSSIAFNLIHLAVNEKLNSEGRMAEFGRAAKLQKSVQLGSQAVAETYNVKLLTDQPDFIKLIEGLGIRLEMIARTPALELASESANATLTKNATIGKYKGQAIVQKMDLRSNYNHSAELIETQRRMLNVNLTGLNAEQRQKMVQGIGRNLEGFIEKNSAQIIKDIREGRLSPQQGRLLFNQMSDLVLAGTLKLVIDNQKGDQLNRIIDESSKSINNMQVVQPAAAEEKSSTGTQNIVVASLMARKLNQSVEQPSEISLISNVEEKINKMQELIERFATLDQDSVGREHVAGNIFEAVEGACMNIEALIKDGQVEPDDVNKCLEQLSQVVERARIENVLDDETAGVLDAKIFDASAGMQRPTI